MTTPTVETFSLSDVTAAFRQGVRLGRLSVNPNTSGSAPATKEDVWKATNTIMAKLSTLAASVAALTAQVQKSKDEIVAKIAALENALADVDLPADAETALEELKGAVQAVDDINPDPAPPVA
jgi:hypothetical protein